MIKTDEQAIAVQQRRVDAGLFGYAKAVRRYIRRAHKDNYLAVRNQLQALWPGQKKGGDDEPESDK